MSKNENLTMGTMTDEQIAEMFEETYGCEIPQEPIEELVEEGYEEPVVEEKSEPKFVFSFDLMDNKEEKVASEKFVLDAMHEAMKEIFFDKVKDPRTGEKITNSKLMARARFYISGEDDNGLPYGNFNGAGARAITMYQPDHPEAPKKGRNYGKVFYKWSDPRVEKLLDAIFEECGWDPKLLLKEEKEEEEVPIEE